MSQPAAIAAWHRVVDSGDVGLLEGLLADDVVFRSPAVHTPQEGRTLTTAYLRAALEVLGPALTYHRELVGDDSAALEFTTTLTDDQGRSIQVHGIDLVRWDTDDRIVEFTVLVRPLKGLTTLVEHMGAALQRG